MIEHGVVTVTRSEMMDMQLSNPLFYDDSFLFMLKDKGVPVNGWFLPRLDNRFSFESNKDYDTGDIKVRWAKK